MFTSLLVANRGEIACRIIRTAKAMGLRTIAVYSAADHAALHVEMADEAYPIGGAPAIESYLRAERVVEAAKAARADAIHPGYGFLAENADFTEACGEAGISFVGPPPNAIRAMGAKDVARRLMKAAGVPVVPGYEGEDQSDGAFVTAAEEIGFPLLVKPAMGGGGKGMRRVKDLAALLEALAAARREAGSAFGDDRLVIERLVESARHIEIQIFADSHGNCVHLYERECSLQRRHQKVVEEAPAPGMKDGLRGRMADAALAAARAVGYVGAGTVEFLVDASAPLDDETPFHFLEMNTRLQVEHPVTEEATGLDLVEWQLRVAAGEPLPLGQAAIRLAGHAVEARVYAEDPLLGFLPSTGRLVAFEWPERDGLRLDAGVRAGDEITSHYDPLIAKVIGRGADRDAAIGRLSRGLASGIVAGPRTNLAFLAAVIGRPDFRRGRVDTELIDRELDVIVGPLRAPDAAMLAAGARAAALDGCRARHATSTGCPWSATDGFQLGPPRRSPIDVIADGRRCTVGVEWRSARALVSGGPAGGYWIGRDGGDMLVVGHGRQLRIRLADRSALTEGAGPDARLIAPMPGQVIRLDAEEGDRVRAGDPILVLEAMKMEHVVRAPRDGRITSLNVAQGGQVEVGAVLAVIDGGEDWP